MADANFCPNCGAKRAADAPPGICTVCKTQQAQSDATIAPDDASTLDSGIAEAVLVETITRDDHTSDCRSGTDETTQTAAQPHPSRNFPARTLIRYFGDYELQNELGSGGMGVVYKARQVSLNRPVALKMIKTGVLADDADLGRFQLEAEAVALLDHPGIIPVYEVGEHDGQRYFSMKLIEGSNLSSRLATFRTNPRAAAALMAELAEAVHHAHMRGILHRDLKPANILIDSEGRPHVTDFGLAKEIEGGAELTLSGAILGTPKYMSPEQAYGRRRSITTATDVYGLGAILYALLAGKAPFGGESVLETLDAVRKNLPDPPRKFNLNTPPDLETICLKCLEKDPRRRYASAHALADDLRNWLDSRPITARRVGAIERAWLWCKRKPAIAMLTAAVVLALIAGISGIIAVQARANTNLRSANRKLDQQRHRAEFNETQAIEAVKKFRDAIENEPELKKTPTLENLRKRLLKEPLTFFRALRDRLQADPDTRKQSLDRLADAGFELGYLSNEIGDKQDAIVTYREALEIQKELAKNDPGGVPLQLKLATIQNNLGVLLRDTGQSDEAMKALKSSIKIRQKYAARNPSVHGFHQNDLSVSHNNLGVLLKDTGHFAEALSEYRAGLAIQQKMAEANPEVNQFQQDLGVSHNNIGMMLSEMGQPYEALTSVRTAVGILKKLADANPTVTDYQRELAASQNSLGLLLRGVGEPSEAMKVFQESLTIRKQLTESMPSITQFQSDLSYSYNNIAALLAEIGKSTEAIKPCELAISIKKKLAEGNPTDIQMQRRPWCQL